LCHLTTAFFNIMWYPTNIYDPKSMSVQFFKIIKLIKTHLSRYCSLLLICCGVGYLKKLHYRSHASDTFQYMQYINMQSNLY
jgi:hypothetical protein